MSRVIRCLLTELGLPLEFLVRLLPETGCGEAWKTRSKHCPG